jgi:hypothetical protein
VTTLVHGDHFSAEEKEAAAAAARKELLASDPEVAGGFTVERLSLWRTDIHDRSCQSWERVDYFPLQT